MPPQIIKTFSKGLVTRIEDKDAGRGSASDCLNWHFLGDHIELRRGRSVLGTEVVGGGRITGLRVGRRSDGVQFPFFTYGQKVWYHTVSTGLNTEVSTNLLPAAILDTSGAAEDVAIETYNSLAGAMVYLSSPNSSFYKIPIANPGSAVDLLSNEYRGKFRIKSSRTFLWDRKDDFGGKDQSGLYLSHIDATENIYQYTKQESAGSGDGVTKTFAGTLAFKAANSKETCFFVVIAGAKSAGVNITAISKATAAVVTSAGHGLVVGDSVIIAGVIGMTEINNMVGVVTAITATTYTLNIDSTNFTIYSSGGTGYKAERFIDDKSGNFTSTEGGTGTINYATGAYSVTFFNAIINSTTVVAQYFREDSTRETGATPTSGGILNFNFSAARGLGEGNVFRQDDGGGRFMAMESFGGSEYCLHQYKTWVLTIPAPDDTDSSNLIYRDNVGIPYWRAARATGRGIYYVDVIGDTPAFRLLEYGRINSQVVPNSVSDSLDLRAYAFDSAVVFEWGDYLCIACNSNTETVNNRLFMRHKIWNTWEVHSFRVSVMDILNGALIAGDSGSNNMYKLFTGLADGDSAIENYFITNNDLLGKEGIKTANRMKVAGLIGIDQGMKVSYSLDGGDFTEILASDGTSPLIEGTGSYVNQAQRKLIGSMTLGESQIGGGQDPANSIYASPYELEFFVGTDRLERIRLKFEATATGYLSVSEYGFVDIRDKGMSLPVRSLQ